MSTHPTTPPLACGEGERIEARVRAANEHRRLPILCLDFDGVLHSYASGWKGAALIPDPPVPGAMEFVAAAVRRFRVAIYSSRSGQPGGIDAMRLWLRAHFTAVCDDAGEVAHVLSLIEWPTEKPPALVTLDDRALTFTGEWPALDALAAFQPWNKRAVAPTPLYTAADLAAAREEGRRECVAVVQDMRNRWCDATLQLERGDARDIASAKAGVLRDVLDALTPGGPHV